MAKAREIPGLSAQESYAVAAARIVEVRSAELSDHVDGVLDTGDIERLHDMRVATRRLRAALEVFEPCFSGKRFRAALREVRGLADALGERRDLDVAIAALEDFAAAVPTADRGGVRGLINDLRSEQRTVNQALGPQVTAERLESLRRLLGELIADPAPETPEEDAAEGPADAVARAAGAANPEARATGAAEAPSERSGDGEGEAG